MTMPCLKPDGTLSPIGVRALKRAQKGATAEEIAGAIGLPLFRARSAIRGLVKAGLMQQDGEVCLATSIGLAKLQP